MHHALLVSDVRLYIFAYVDQIRSTGKRSLSRTSLASLAVTCKAFHEPAMDLLWAEVDRLQPLLGCVTRLHPLIYPRSRMVWDDTWTEGIEPLSADEIHQFLRHSARIRSLSMPSESTDRLFPLFSIIPQACVFPRLESLTLFTATHLGLFLSDKLRHCSVFDVEVEPPQSPTVHGVDLEDLSDDGDYLEELSDERILDQLSLLSSRIRSCKQLVTLSCPPLDWAAWKHLSNLPTLMEVGIREVRKEFGAPLWPLDRHIANFTPFFNLTVLSFTVDDTEYVTTILRHSQFPSLKRFWIMVAAPTATEANQLFHALSHYKQTLEQLTVIMSSYNHGFQNKYLTITQFFCFTQLRLLHLDCIESRIYLDNNLLLEAMSAWPHIEFFKIEDFGGNSSVTFRGLFTALSQSPQLESLRLSIDTVNIDIDLHAEPIPNTTLRALDLETSEFHIENAEVIARIIFTWFPCVEQVSKIPHTDSEPWDKVNMHLISLRTGAWHIIGGP
ncbi:hypothetical protein EDD22DRAFT_969449 [Suillus occidentalis]|nr:hypothetical protein EDD22DRAFT_969449 [Suillus occidentalis]